MVLVVEGEDDIQSIRAILASTSPYLKACLDNGDLTLDSLVGGSNLSYKLSLLRDAICSYHVFLDDDSCGREAYRKAKAAGMLEDAHINFAKANGRTESEFEDLLEPSLYCPAVCSKYNVSLLWKTSWAKNQNGHHR
jgi:putative ATP-dependent endonuclease of OLD family